MEQVEKTIEALCNMIQNEAKKENYPEELSALAEVVNATAQLIFAAKN